MKTTTFTVQAIKLNSIKWACFQNFLIKQDKF